MADFISFNEGRQYLLTHTDGLPTTVYFGLSTKSATTFVPGDTLATSGEITGTGYARQSEAAPTPTNANPSVIQFAQKTWATGAATDWPTSVVSVFAATTSDNTGKILAAWNLQAGGAARAMNAASTTENYTPQLTVS